MRVLVRTPNWLGDIVMALPVFDALRAHFTDEVLVAAAPRAFAPMLTAVPAVDQVLPLRRDGRGWRALETEVQQLRDGRFDRVVLLPNSFGAAWVARRAGIEERWGFAAHWRRSLLTQAVPRPRRRATSIHQVDYYLELVRGLGIEVATREPRLTASARMLERAQALLGAAGCDCGRPMVGVAPGAAYGHAKRWPPDRYGRVVARLVRELGVTVVLLGSAYDRNAGYAIESSLTSVGVTGSDAGVVNLIGRTDLSELIGTLAACRGVISGDSGAMHLAAALQVPVTALFGPTDDRLTGPVGAHEVLVHPVWCRPCFFRDCPIDHRCMTRISEDDVFQAISRQLSVPR